MDAFLSSVTDDIEKLKDAEHDAIVLSFGRAMRLAHEVFGRQAFRKREDTPLNRALFDVWSVVLGEHDEQTLRSRKRQICEITVDALLTDADFIRAITQATGDPMRVAHRFEKGRQIITDALA